MIVFRHLLRDDLKLIIDIELAKVRERLLERGLTLELTDDAKEFIIDKGSNLEFGARPLRRAIENFVEDPLSEEILKGTFQGKHNITVRVKEVGEEKQLVFESEAQKEEELAGVGGDSTEGSAQQTPVG